MTQTPLTDKPLAIKGYFFTTICRALTIGEMAAISEMQGWRQIIRFIRGRIGKRLTAPQIAELLRLSNGKRGGSKTDDIVAMSDEVLELNTYRVARFYGWTPKDINAMTIPDFIAAAGAMPEIMHEEAAMASAATHSVIEMPKPKHSNKAVDIKLSDSQQDLINSFMSGGGYGQ